MFAGRAPERRKEAVQARRRDRLFRAHYRSAAVFLRAHAACWPTALPKTLRRVAEGNSAIHAKRSNVQMANDTFDAKLEDVLSITEKIDI